MILRAARQFCRRTRATSIAEFMSNVISRVLRIVNDRGGLLAALKIALSRPAAVTLAFARIASRDWRTLAVGSEKEAAALHAELCESGLIEQLTHRLNDEFASLNGAKVRGRAVVPGGIRLMHAEMLWLLVRGRKPRTVVETGVCNGFSSAVLLEALAANGAGRLISIDLPEFTDPLLNTFNMWEGKAGAVIPAGREVGWLVREGLRSGWRLELGRSQDLLPALLSETRPIELFIHDSEHSYENQLFEFREAYKALGPDGILVATDITWSDAFEDFWLEISETGARRAFVDPSCAIVAKPSS